MKIRFYLLLATLLTLPFALRKVIWAENDQFFNEYTDISLYVYEVFLMGYVLFTILEHKNIIKSISKNMFHVEHLLLGILFCSSTLLAALFQENYFGLYYLGRWILYIIFALFLYHDMKQIVPRGTLDSSLEKCSTWNILKVTLIFILFLEAFLILIQVYLQKSVGLIYLGEAILHPSIAGVSTIIINEREYLRGYGTFLHPNIAAFFFFVYITTIYLLHIVPRGTFKHNNNINCSTWNNLFPLKWQKLFHVEQSFFSKYLNIVPRGTILVVFLIIIIGFLLTFSKSVIISGILVLLSSIYILHCSTWNSKIKKYFRKLFHVDHNSWFRYFNNVPRGTSYIIVGVIMAVFLWDLTSKLPDFIQQSILERKMQYLSIPISSPLDIIVGQGLGTYVETLEEKSPGLYSWQLQPIHNTFFLLIFEIGLLPILGLSTFLWLKSRGYRGIALQRLSDFQKIILIIGGVTLMLLGIDHYTWDIEQGQILFVILVTLLVFSFNSAIFKKEK